MSGDTVTLYRKQGRRYVPVSEYERMQGDEWRQGCNLTVITPGVTFHRVSVKPSKAGLLAALYLHREACIEAIRKMTEARPIIKEPLTPKQAKAWQQWQDACGSLHAVEIPAVAECFDAIVRTVEEAPTEVDA